MIKRQFTGIETKRGKKGGLDNYFICAIMELDEDLTNKKFVLY